VRTDLSTEAKQSFQIAALLATILVVGIHYKSDVPDTANPLNCSWNQLAQEFLFGGIARVAVPLFALAAGLFYFRSDDGSWTSYQTKFKQRSRTLLIPYLIVSTFAFVVWLMSAGVEGRAIDLGISDGIARWLLHPLAEQLWFLRDLMVLVAIAPLIRFCCGNRVLQPVFLPSLLFLWGANFQPFPIIAGWHLIHMETLLFFSIGCVATMHPKWIESIGRVSGKMVLTTTAAWCMLVAMRISVKADLDLWYVSEHGFTDLMLHQSSILVGCLALFMIAFRLRHPRLIQISGASFFVYLVHEFPLRAVVHKLGDRILDHETSSWVTTPLVLLGCFAAAFVLSRYAPFIVDVLTGGRTPAKASQIGGPSTLSTKSTIEVDSIRGGVA
jgi:surface polysaccharide O-acyltransferase-like enzyme